MTIQEIRPAGQPDLDASVAMITRAFASDPGVRWMYPD